jgi:hypothetical protein
MAAGIYKARKNLLVSGQRYRPGETIDVVIEPERARQLIEHHWIYPAPGEPQLGPPKAPRRRTREAAS